MDGGKEPRINDKALQHLLAKRPEIISIKIANSSCSNTGLQAVLAHQAIIVVHLDGAELTGESLSPDLEYSQSLKELSLIDCEKLTDYGLRIILTSAGRNLTSLRLSNTRLSLAGIGTLTVALGGLEVLNLSCCVNITDIGLIPLLQKTEDSLKHLDLRYTSVTLSHDGYSSLHLPSLLVLKLSHCGNLDDTGLIHMLNKATSNLKQLDLRFTNVTLSNAGAIASDFKNLKVLDLSNNRQLDEEGTVCLLNKSGYGLKELDLSETNITLSDPQVLTVNFTQLRALKLSYCWHLAEAAIDGFLNRVGASLKVLDLRYTNVSLLDSGFISNLENLEELNLTSCRKLSEAGLVSLLNSCRLSLVHLNLSYTKITLSTASSIQSNLPRLRSLNLSHCKHLTEFGVFSLLSKTSGNLMHLDVTGSNVTRLDSTSSRLEGFQLSSCRELSVAGPICLLNKAGQIMRCQVLAPSIA